MHFSLAIIRMVYFVEKNQEMQVSTGANFQQKTGEIVSNVRALVIAAKLIFNEQINKNCLCSDD